MNPSVVKYKETKEHKTLLMKVISGQKWPWITKWIKIAFGILGTPLRHIKPISDWMAKMPGGANGRLFKLIREKRFEEGYQFGIERLNELLSEMPNPEGSYHPAFYTSWWMAFNSVCECALEINNDKAFSVLCELVERGPEPKEGFPVVQSFSSLSRIAYEKGNSEAAWDWIDRAVKCDDSYGWAYYFRAWLGAVLKKGQPLNDLVLCIQNEPEMKDAIFGDELFNKTPQLMNDLRTRLIEKGKNL